MKKKWILSISICFLVTFIICSVDLINATEEYSDELKYERFSSVSSLEGWFDAVDTFYDDNVGDKPKYWKTDLGGSAYCEIKAELDNHKNVLDFYDGNGNSEVYYMNFDDLIYNRSEGNTFFLDVWLAGSDASKYSEFEIITDVGVIRIAFSSDGKVTLYQSINGVNADDTFSYSINTFYHFSIYQDLENDKIKIDYKDGTHTFGNVISKSFEVNKLHLQTSDIEHSMYLDGLGFGSDLVTYNRQIRNIKYERKDNYEAFGSDEYVSMYKTLSDQKPDEENNYRNELITDNIITDQYIDPERILRMEGTDTAQTKYKVNQFYFTDLNETYNKYLSTNITKYYGDNIENSNITIREGVLNRSRDLSEIDGERTSINSTSLGDGYKGTYIAGGNNVGDTSTEIDFIDNDATDGGKAEIIDGFDGHRKVLVVNDSSTTGHVDFSKDFGEPTSEDGCVEFWIATNETNRDLDLLIRDDYNEVLHIRNLYPSHYEYKIRTSSAWKGIFEPMANVFTHVKIKPDVSENTFDVYVNDTLVLEGQTPNEPFVDGIDRVDITSDVYDDSQTFETFLDAWGLPGHDGDYSEGDNLISPSARLEIDICGKREVSDYGEIYLNYALNTTIAQKLNVSVFNNDLGKYDTLNFTRFNLTQNTYMLNKSYFNATNHINLKIKGENQTTEFKLLIDKLTLNWSKKESYLPHKQRLEIRVNTYNSADLLINILKWNIQFNNSHGNITWDIMYRENENTPRWNPEPTNPIFRFSDYLNESLEYLQVNAHFFLTEHSNQKWLYIRTQVCFNDLIENIYSYDKVISLGNSSFYDTQSRIGIQYIDYFNPNHFGDYEIVNNSVTTPYTFNNLRGFRTLKLNSTEMKYNFLECGFYNSELDIKPPDESEPDEPDEDDLDDDEGEPKPQGMDGYWLYNSYEIEVQNTLDLTIGEADGDIETWTVEFNTLHAKERKAKYWYNLDMVPYQDPNDWNDWKIEFIFDFTLNLNLLRNTVCTVLNIFIGIINLAMIALQFGGYALTVAFNYIIMYLLVGIILCYLWNVVVKALYEGLLGVLWIIAEFIWSMTADIIEWFIDEALPVLIDFLVDVITWVLAALVWLVFLGKADFDEIYNNIHDLMVKASEYMVDSFVLFIENLPYFIVYLGGIVILFFMAWGREAITRARGMPNRAEQLESMKIALLYIPMLIVSIAKTMKEILFGWT